MKTTDFSLQYYDGTEIELGDTVRYADEIGEIERIIYPNTKNCSDYNVKNGGILLRMSNGTLYAFDFDYYELKCSVSFVFLHRAKIVFHLQYSIRKFLVFIGNINFLFRECFHGNISDGMCFFKEWYFSVLEFLQALVRGPGKYVSQMGAGEDVAIV
jgi:hypothetical protein